jgi:hypothetical protein
MMTATRVTAGWAALLALALALAGCGREPTPAPDAPAPEPAPPAPEPVFDPLGSWSVVGYSTPGVSAVTDDEAKAHEGQTLRFGPAEALSNGERCGDPRYPVRSVETEQFLATEFNLPPETLKPLAGKDRVSVVEVSCDGAAWTAFGSLLIAIDADRALAPWDGVFYELKRAPPAG